MDLRLPHVRAFLVVAEELHFGRAAARLRVGQPLVSRHVRALEDELHAPLLVRTSRHVELTDAGRAAIPHFRALLDLADRLAGAVADAAAGMTGVVTVGFAPSTIDRYMPPLIEAMGERYPRVELRTIQPRIADARSLLLRGELDGMVVRGIGATEGLVATELQREPLFAAIPDAHPLARRDSLDVPDFDGESLVIVHPVGMDPASITERRLREFGLAPSAIRYTTSIPAALAYVAAGVGINPRVPASSTQERAGVTYVPIDGRR